MKKIKTLVHNILLIKEGETTPLIHFWFIFMLTLGAGLAVGRASSDTLFLTRYGIEYLPLIYIALAPLLALVSIAYAAIVDSVSSEKFFSFILTGLIFAVFLSWLMMSQTNSSFIYPFYFIVHKIASELLVVHGSLYLIHNFNTLQAKRLFPIIFTGEQLGCILGGFLVSGSVSVLDTENLPLLWVVLMLAGILQLKYWHSHRGASPYFQSNKKPGSKLKVAVQSVYQGLSFTRESSLLRYASFALFFLVIIYYILSYSTNRIFVDTFKNEDDLARFLGLLTVGTSSITLLLQLFVTNRIIRRFGVKKLNLVFPAAIASAALGLLVSFTLTFAIIASVVRDSLLNSLQNPLRIIFFNALPSFMQGRAGAVSIAVVMPAALLVCGLLLWQIQSLNNVVYFVAPCVLLAFAFFYYCYKMNKTYTDTLTSNLKNRLYLPDNNLKNTHIELDDSTLQSIKNTFDELPQARAITLSLLVSHYPEKSIDFIASKLKELPASETDVFLHLLFNKLGGSLPYDIIKKFPLKDSHIKTTLLILLADNNYPEAVTLAEKNIDTSSVRVKAAIAYSFLKDSNQKNYNAAIEIWSHLLNGDKHSQIATLILLPLLKNIKENDYIVLAAKTKKTIDSILNDEDMDLVGRTLKQLPLELTFINHNTIERCVNLLINQTNPHFRENAVFGLKFLSEEARYRVIYDLLNDSHTSVRQNTLLNIDLEKRDKETLINQWLINGKSSPRIQSTILEYIINNEVFSHNVLSTLALNKATNACDYSVAISIINNDSNDLDINENLVLLILNERKIQMIDLALQALTPLCAKDQITVIRAGLVSKNEQHIANACEILNNIDFQYKLDCHLFHLCLLSLNC